MASLKMEAPLAFSFMDLRKHMMLETWGVPHDAGLKSEAKESPNSANRGWKRDAALLLFLRELRRGVKTGQHNLSDFGCNILPSGIQCGLCCEPHARHRAKQFTSSSRGCCGLVLTARSETCNL